MVRGQSLGVVVEGRGRRAKDRGTRPADVFVWSGGRTRACVLPQDSFEAEAQDCSVEVNIPSLACTQGRWLSPTCEREEGGGSKGGRVGMVAVAEVHNAEQGFAVQPGEPSETWLGQGTEGGRDGSSRVGGGSIRSGGAAAGSV